MQMLMHQGNTRVSASSVHFFSPSPSRNNSNLSHYLALASQPLCIHRISYHLSQTKLHLPGNLFNRQTAWTERDNATNLSGAFIFTTSPAEFLMGNLVSEQIEHIGVVASLLVYSRRNCNFQR
jgi:hypothetical protein